MPALTPPAVTVGSYLIFQIFSVPVCEVERISALILYVTVRRNYCNHIFKHLTQCLALRKLINLSYLNQQMPMNLSGMHLTVCAVQFQPQEGEHQEIQRSCCYFLVLHLRCCCCFDVLPPQAGGRRGCGPPHKDRKNYLGNKMIFSPNYLVQEGKTVCVWVGVFICVLKFSAPRPNIQQRAKSSCSVLIVHHNLQEKDFLNVLFLF